jgi:hypothetical protein
LRGADRGCFDFITFTFTPTPSRNLMQEPGEGEGKEVARMEKKERKENKK